MSIYQKLCTSGRHSSDLVLWVVDYHNFVVFNSARVYHPMIEERLCLGRNKTRLKPM